MKPKVSIVTPSYNQGDYIEDAINSVLSQDYDRLEYIIIDGGSTDQTKDIVDKYLDSIDIFISEPDKGQSHAINKGWRMASGDFVAWLNSDDMYVKGAISKVMEIFDNETNVGMIYGNAIYIDERGNKIGCAIPSKRNYWYGLPTDIPQPTIFIKADLLKKIGFIREELNYAMDYDLYQRLVKVAKIHYTDQFLAKMRLYRGTKSSTNISENMKEKLQVIKKYQKLWFLSPYFFKYLRHKLGMKLPKDVRNKFRDLRKLPRDGILKE